MYWTEKLNLIRCCIRNQTGFVKKRFSFFDTNLQTEIELMGK